MFVSPCHSFLDKHKRIFAFLIFNFVITNRMVAHAIELLTAGSDQAEVILHEERYNLGEISIAELHRLVYAQVLSSHALTWQVSV